MPLQATKTRDSESPAPRRARSDTPSDMSDSEEGQVHKGSKGSDNSSLDGVQLKTDDKLTLADLNKARITRDMLEKHCFSSHFEEYIKGGAFTLTTLKGLRLTVLRQVVGSGFSLAWITTRWCTGCAR